MVRQNWISRVFFIACIAIFFVYGSAPLFLPKPAPVSVPNDQFSAERALQSVRVLAQSPRVTGTQGMERAVSYLVEVLRTCNLSPEIQDTTFQNRNLHNIIVRIPGIQPGNAVLIVSHVDSVSYGAGDNATGAAVLTELACNLQAGKLPNNDVILLFEDGEEDGYLGGYAFAKADASISSIHRVIGMDTAAWGPVVLLQTTPGNSDFVRAYASSVPDPTAFGFFADADWNISHDTSEIQPFYERSIPGLELEDPTAFSGKHSEKDTVDNINPGAMQQMGEQVLALTRFLGDSDLSRSTGSNQSYFTLWGLGVVHYPSNCNIVAAILSIVAITGLTVKKIQQKSVTWHLTINFALLLFLAFVGTAIIGLAASVIFEKLFPNPNPQTGSYLIAASLPFFLAVNLITTISFLFIRDKLVKRLGSMPGIIAGMLCWFILAITTALLLQVGSYIFTIPLLFVIGVSILPTKIKYARFIPAIVATVLFTPNVVLAYLGTGQQTLVLVTLFVAMDSELWAEAYSDFST